MKVLVGVEKECLVFDQEYNPVDLDLDLLPEELTVDFANHQLEVVTKPQNSALSISRYINKLLSLEYFEQKKIWPLSMPMAENKHVMHNKLDAKYRNGLAEKYGIDKMLYSGIHFNYSNDLLHTKQEYFQLIQNVFDYMPIIMQFTSYTPYAHSNLGDLEKIGSNWGFKDSMSLRSSERYGYSNEGDVNLDFSSYDQYLASKEYAITAGGLIDEREIYSKIRLKSAGGNNYIELRFIDINPFIPAGISDESLVFIESCLNYLSTITNSQFDYKVASEQIEDTALHGRDRTRVLTIGGQHKSIYNHTIELLDQLISMSTVNTYTEALQGLRLKYLHNQLDIDVMCRMIESENLSLQQFGIENVHIKKKFNSEFEQYNMELSTKLIMSAALKRGYRVSVESESKNIIKVSDENQSHYLIQATKTNLDGFASVLLMDDKFMTKKILTENDIAVPAGIKLHKGQQLTRRFEYDVVVKPLDTNFGLGISIVDGQDQNQLVNACNNAFKYSEQILIEQFISGQEFRFLIIDGVVESIVTRKNANVIGDGHKTIRELIDVKNSSQLRSRGYKTPLEEIIIDDDLKRVVSQQGYDLDTVVDTSVKVLLRDTSNVSQGGDSHEVFNVIPDQYKTEAIDAAHALGATICGIDMIIDFEQNQHAIIEANYNPAIHMHMYPYSGRGRDVASKVLDALFKK